MSQNYRRGPRARSQRVIAFAVRASGVPLLCFWPRSGIQNRACASSARAPSRNTSVSGSIKLPGWESWKTLVSVTAYHSFAGEVEALNTPTIRRLTPSRRHELSTIARRRSKPSVTLFERRSKNKAAPAGDRSCFAFNGRGKGVLKTARTGKR
jgi:hypothetical protein